MNPVKWATRRWRQWRARKSLLVLVIFCTARGDSDAVAAIASFLSAWFSRALPTVVLNSALSHLQDVLALVAADVRPNRVVLFAHPTDSHDGFAINLSADLEITVLRRDWWIGGASRTPELLVAHVCEGAQILRQPFWADVFSNGISYECTIEGYVASALGRDRWARIARGTAESAVEGNTPASVLGRIKRTYLDEMISISDHPDYVQGDTINLCNFEKAYQHLVGNDGVA